MGWSYSGNPASSVKDAVRFEIQDTDEEAHLLEDDEVLYAISQETTSATPSIGEVLSAAARCLEALSRRFLAQADKVTGSIRVTYSKQAKQYAEEAKALRERAAGMNAPWTGGVTEAERESREQDTSAIPPAFTRDQFENPFAEGEGLTTEILRVSEGQA